MIKKLLVIALPVLFCLDAFSQGAPACPAVTTGATQTICNGNCATLTSTLVTNNATTSYSVSSIPYAPYSFTTGTQILVATDDLWSPIQNLLFNFCFFGTSYNQCVVGANGHITFDMSYANAYDSYPVTTPLPSTVDMPANTINAVFRDIDPSVGGQIYYDVGGTAPCRYVSISWYNVPLYSCNSTHCTFQLVLYENTNFIDVYIQSSAGTCSWNSGNGIIGIQNSGPTVAVCPPSRNCTNFTGTNEAWRFTPTGSPSYTFKWIGPGNVTVGTTQTLTVCPSTTTTYTASMTVTNCDGSSFTKTNTQQVTVNPGPAISVGSATICPGKSTTLTASGGTTYSWSPGTGLSGTTGASVTASPASTTVYTVSGTTAGCTGTATSTVTVSSSPVVTATSATICPGSSATLTASGASTYTWSPGTGLSGTTGASVTSTPASSTVYTVTGTSVAGCTATATSSVTIASAITPVVNSATICTGNSATLNASGGTTYTWSPGTGLSGTTGASVTANPTSTTVYTITAASGGCTGTTTATVAVNPLPTVTASSGTICPGNSTTLNASGASNYTWSPGTGLSGTTGSSVIANPSSTTAYTITGADANGCVNKGTTSVTVNPTPTVTAISTTVCPGSSGTVTASGASTYTWNTGATGSTLTQSPGATTTYTVTGASAGGCTNTATASITVGSSLVVVVNSATICAGSPATLNASGAASYTWSPATGLSGTSGASVTANPPTTTTYTIVGASGTCTASATSTVQVNPLPVVTAASASICIGQQTATLTASGASTYSWSPGTGLSGTTGSSVTANPSSTTTYTITGTDANGCVNTGTPTVTVNPLPVIPVNSATICPTFSATLTASGASTYTWNTGGTGSSMTASPASTTSYSVTGTDVNGCTSSNTATITVNPTLLVSATNNSAICAGATLNLSASIGVAWSWTGPSGFTSSSQNPVLSPATPAMSGTYSVTATDANGCQGSAVTTVTVNPLPTITIGSNSPVCVNQVINLTSTGGPGYAWSGPSSFTSTQQNPTISGATTGNGGTYSLTVTDANSCVSTGTVNVVVNPLPVISVSSATICPTFSATLTASGASTYTWNTGGTGSSMTASPSSTTSYSVIGTDVNGCASSNTATITVNPTLLVSATNNSAICEGATLNLSASTGVLWSWTGPGGFTSSSQNPVLSPATPAMSGTYSVTATDANGCQGSAVTTVTVNPLPTITVGSNSPVCVNQAINLTSTGGPGYAWSGPSSFTSTQQNPTISGATTGNGGTYSLTVTDANSCVSTATVNVVVNPLPVISVTGATVCIGATINLSANGGVSYSWSGPNSYNSNQQNPSISPAAINMSGNYVVTVTDNNGCVNANIAQVTVNPALVISASNNGPLCVNATLNLNASAGVSWSWSGPGVFTSFSQNPSIPNIQLANAGTYIVTGIDQNGCSGTDSTTVVVNPLPVISANSDTICAGQQSATLIANGGVTYTWSPSLGLNNTNGSTVVANPMVNVTYTVTGTDVNGCSNTANSTVSVNQPPIVTATSATVCLGNSGTLTASGAATYTWAPSTGLNQNTGSSVTSSPSSTTSYTIIGVDNNGCYNSGVCTVVVNPLPVFTVSSGTICAGASTTLNANGTSSYSWFPATGLNVTSGPNVTASPSATTTYSVIGTDLNNCSDTMTTSVTVNPLPQVSIIPKISSGCSPVCVTTFSNTTSANGTCNWTFSDGTTSSYCTPGHCFSGQGTFYSIMTLTDGNGCKGKDSAKVIVYPIPNADFNWQPQPASILDPIIGFYNESSGAMINTWKWSFGDPGNHTSLLQNPSFDFENAGTYTTQLLVISNYGCVDSVSKVVVIDADYMIYVPNAFTPNDDGTNEIFSAKGEGIDEFRMYIFDRWGNEVFFSDDIYKGWDGRYQAKGNDILPQDLYVWKIELKTYKGEAKMLKGTVSLLK